jgi:hypothetical protein
VIPARASGSTRELAAWIEERPRTYRDTIEAWVSNCPRLSVWDDAVSDGLVEVVRVDGREAMVSLTASGKALLQRS